MRFNFNVLQFNFILFCQSVLERLSNYRRSYYARSIMGWVASRVLGWGGWLGFRAILALIDQSYDLLLQLRYLTLDESPQPVLLSDDNPDWCDFSPVAHDLLSHVLLKLCLEDHRCLPYRRRLHLFRVRPVHRCLWNRSGFVMLRDHFNVSLFSRWRLVVVNDAGPAGNLYVSLVESPIADLLIRHFFYWLLRHVVIDFRNLWGCGLRGQHELFEIPVWYMRDLFMHALSYKGFDYRIRITYDILPSFLATMILLFNIF